MAAPSHPASIRNLNCHAQHAAQFAEDLPRRRFLWESGAGIGGIALATLLQKSNASDALPPRQPARANAAGVSGFPNQPATAKRIIYLFQSGAPSQIDLFDEKPQLKALANTDLPESVRMGQRLTGMTATQERFPIAPSIYKFAKHGQCGANISELLPHTAQVVDDLCFVRTLHTTAINHDPAVTFFQTGFQLAGRPSIGAWLAYGLGSDNDDLPAFVAMISGSGGQPLYDRLWGSGFLPSKYQGVKFRSVGDPVLFLSNPNGVSVETRRQQLDDIASLNALKYQQTADPEINTRIAQYEMAFRMQTSVPELTDLSHEPQSTFDLYGDEARKPGTYSYNCLLARRMAERGVRFIQLFHRDWDHHLALPKGIELQTRATDRASAALIRDLKQRGLLDDTLVVWGGEFGRTTYCQGRLSAHDYGRDHHPRCFTAWLAGGGIKGGITHGTTDEFSYNITDKPVHVHDFHATLLHCLGIDHTRLTYRFQGRDYRLTDVHGNVVRELLT